MLDYREGEDTGGGKKMITKERLKTEGGQWPHDDHWFDYLILPSTVIFALFKMNFENISL